MSTKATGRPASTRGLARGPVSYRLSKAESIAKLSTEPEPQAPVVVSEVTSEAYDARHPPRDWADIGLLIPHEAIRRDMAAMVESVAALPDTLDKRSAWRGVYFARWYSEYFHRNVHDHHDNEEELYFPWIATRADLPGKLAMSHEELVATMERIKGYCDGIRNKPDGCAAEIAELKRAVPAFVSDMKAHLREEEEIVPGLLRDNFTQAEEEEVVVKIIQRGGMEEVRAFLPAILLAMQKWALPVFYDEFIKSMPPPVSQALLENFLPDYDTYVYPMRDAPTLKYEPRLRKHDDVEEEAEDGAYNEFLEFLDR